MNVEDLKQYDRLRINTKVISTEDTSYGLKVVYNYQVVGINNNLFIRIYNSLIAFFFVLALVYAFQELAHVFEFIVYTFLFLLLSFYKTADCILEINSFDKLSIGKETVIREFSNKNEALQYYKDASECLSYLKLKSP